MKDKEQLDRGKKRFLERIAEEQEAEKLIKDYTPEEQEEDVSDTNDFQNTIRN